MRMQLIKCFLLLLVLTFILNSLVFNFNKLLKHSNIKTFILQSWNKYESRYYFTLTWGTCFTVLHCCIVRLSCWIVLHSWAGWLHYWWVLHSWAGWLLVLHWLVWRLQPCVALHSGGGLLLHYCSILYHSSNWLLVLVVARRTHDTKWCSAVVIVAPWVASGAR